MIKLGSGNVPREIYIFTILISYVVFGFLLAGLGNTMNNLNPDCSYNNCIPNSYGGISTENTSGFVDWGTDRAIDKTINPETKGLFKWIVSGFEGLPDWLNIIFYIMTALVIILLIIVIVHG